MAKGAYNPQRPGLRIELRGADALSNALLELPRGLRNSALRKAINKAGRVMVPPLRRATPRSRKGAKSRSAAARNPPGTLRKSTGIVLRKYKGGLIQAAYIGHRWPKGAAAHLVEGGSKQRRTRRGHNRGIMPKARFFRPVYDTYRNKMYSTMREELAKAIEQARQKAAMKALKKSVAKG